MRRALHVSFLASALVVGLGLALAAPGCASLPRVVGAETAAKVELTALKAAKTSLTVWAYTQRGVLIYGHLPNCDPQLPDLKICKDREAWGKVKSIEAATTATILAARPIVEAGTDDAAFLMGVAAAVNTAIIEINEAKGVSP
jgi:hypothetical protein